MFEDLGDGNHRLTIKDIQESDFGTLRCVAQNKNGTDECEANFEPNAEWLARKKNQEGYPPRFNVPLWDRRLPENLPASIECHVDAKPSAEIVWTKNGVMLESSNELEIRNSPDGTCFLRIAHFTPKDIGEYKCQAKNEYGIADTRSNLSVEQSKDDDDQSAKEHAPKFNPGLEDKSLKVGELLKLSCQVVAVPIAAITWYKDGVPLKSNDTVKLSYDENNGECFFTVNDVKEDNAGAYRCVASNSIGSTNTGCNVNVKGEKKEVSKFFLNNNKNFVN